MGRKGNLAIFEGSNISETGEVTPIKLVCMHLTSIPTCMNFLSRFRSIKFFDDYYSPCLEREIWPFLKCSNISETGETTPTKTGVHALDIDPYLHDFFELIPID